MNPGSSLAIGQQLRSWWDRLTDDEKQSALDTVGELAGGTLGAISGSGIASIPAAGAGAVVGKGFARGAGQAIGLKPTPKSDLETTKEIAGTFVQNAAGEGVGRAVAPAYRGVKSLAQRAVQLAAKPNQRAISLASKAGVELTPGMASDRPLMAFVESALEKTPGGTNTIRGKTAKAVSQWEGSARKIPEQFHPNRVEDLEAGQALQDQLTGNRGAAAQHYKGQYAPIDAVIGETPIDFSVAKGEARAFIEGLPQGMEAFFPKEVLGKLRQIAGMDDVQRIPGGAIDTGYPAMTFSEAKQIRTALLEAERAMTHGDASIQRQAIPALRNAIDTSIDETLKNSTDPAHAKALQDWRAVNADYRDTSATLYSQGGKGNPTTRTIERSTQPDSLPQGINNSPTAIAETKQATAPMFGAGDMKALPKLQRNRADALLDKSQTQNRAVGDDLYINPRRLEKTLNQTDDSVQALFGPGPYQELRDSVHLGKAVTRPAQITNTSETARYNNLLRYGGAIGGAATGVATGDQEASKVGRALAGAAIGGYAIPRAAAGAWMGPLGRAITSAPAPLKTPVGGAVAGAVGRLAAGALKSPNSSSAASSDLPADFLADSPGDDGGLPDDFIDHEATSKLKQSKPPALPKF